MNTKSTLGLFCLLSISIQAYGFINNPMAVCFTSAHTDKQKPEYKYAQNSEGIYQDAVGDAFEFIDLTKLKISIDDEKIAVYISLTYIPQLLVFDRADLTDDTLEYEW